MDVAGGERPRSGELGSASIEQAGLTLLVALALVAGIAALGADPSPHSAREVGTAIARKLRCGPRLPGPCWQDPLTRAYGRPLAGLVRALAPAPRALAGSSGAQLLPVDFRYCRSESCATAAGDIHLTVSNRRTTAFTSVDDRRRSDGIVRISYWLYRPGLGWEQTVREAGAADVAAHAETPLPETADPRLVPLETLPGRNHYSFPPSEEPGWRWRVPGHYPG